jgi:hypothetical protein
MFSYLRKFIRITRYAKNCQKACERSLKAPPHQLGLTFTPAKPYKTLVNLTKEIVMRSIVGGSLFVTCIGVINLVSAIGIPARGDVVTDWNNAALDAIRAGRTAPPIASRSLAILHTAIYDAVNGIARTHEFYLGSRRHPPSASRALLPRCAQATLVNLFSRCWIELRCPSRRDSRHDFNSPQKQRASSWGEFVASQILAAREMMVHCRRFSPPGGSGPWRCDSHASRFLPYLLPNGDSLCRLR